MKKQITQNHQQELTHLNTKHKNRVFRFVLAGGGTGGHIYPAIGIAKALQRLNPKVDIVFIGGRDRLESTIIPQHGFQFLPISVEGFPRNLTFKWIPVIIKVCQGLFQSAKYLKKIHPDVVIGTGGYVSGPVLFAASILRIPIVIQEQNVSPGLTNSILARRVKAAYLALPPDNNRFQTGFVEVTGNPIRLGISEYPRKDETYYKYNLHPDKKTVVVMGGSQGARFINETMIETSEVIAGNFKCIEHTSNSALNNECDSPIQIVHQTGKTDTEQVTEAYQQHGIPHCVQPYFDPVEEIYSIADLMICRAGGMTVSEVTACGIPAIFIPLPAAVGNNQVRNAETVEGKGAAIVLQQEEITPDKLVKELIRILSDDNIYQKMKKASKDLGRPYASDAIAESIFKIAFQQSE